MIKEQTGLDAEVAPGSRGEFSVWVNGRKIAQKDNKGFPEDAAVVAAVRDALVK